MWARLAEAHIAGRATRSYVRPFQRPKAFDLPKRDAGECPSMGHRPIDCPRMWAIYRPLGR